MNPNWDDLLKDLTDYDRERQEFEDSLGMVLPPQYQIKMSKATGEDLEDE